MVGDLIKTNHEKDMKLGEYKVEYVNVLNNREKTKFIILGKHVKLTDSNFQNNEKLKMYDAKNNFIGIGVYTSKMLKPFRLIKFIPNFS